LNIPEPFQNQRTVGSESSKKFRTKELLVLVISKTLRTDGFHQRIGDSLASSSTFSYFLRIVVIYQNWFVEYFEN